MSKDDNRELKNRIEAIIKYGALPVIRYTWTRPAYTDLTSMGREFIEPAAEMVSHRPMNAAELSTAIVEVIDSFDSIPGEINKRLRPDGDKWYLTYCASQFKSNRERCLRRDRCERCDTYVAIIDEFRGKKVPEPVG